MQKLNELTAREAAHTFPGHKVSFQELHLPPSPRKTSVSGI